MTHDGYWRVATRLAWGGGFAVLCLLPQLLLLAMGHGHSRSDRAQFDIHNIQFTLRVYRERKGVWPPEASWSEALITERLLEQEPLDPWHRPYLYRLESDDGGELQPHVTSAGRDGLAGTDDDPPNGIAR